MLLLATESYAEVVVDSAQVVEVPGLEDLRFGRRI